MKSGTHHRWQVEEQGPPTLGRYLKEKLPERSWNAVKSLLAQNVVYVNGQAITRATTALRPRDTVEIRRATSAGVLAVDALIYYDRDVVVVNKPSGVLSIPYEPKDRDTLIGMTAAALRRRAKVDSQRDRVTDTFKSDRYLPELGIVHRLDKETSGLLAFTRTLAAKRFLQQQFREHSIHRRYLALVHGLAQPFVADSWLLENRGDGLRGSWGVGRHARGAKPTSARRAITHVEVLQTFSDAALISCRLHTGRQHQIRIHLSEAGHPLLGETVYCRDYKKRMLDAPRIMLHAAELGFLHPRTQQEIRFNVPAPEDFERCLNRLRETSVR